MFGALLAGAIAGGIGGGIGGLIGGLLEGGDSSTVVCDLPAELTHWQHFEDSWSCMVTVWNLPEWFVQRYINKKMVMAAAPFDHVHRTHLKSKKEKDGKISDVVIPALVYTVQRDAAYSIFLPYSEINTDNLQRILFNIGFYIDDTLILKTTPCFEWNIPKPYRVKTQQHVLLAYCAKIMDELFDFESDQWDSEYDELIKTVFHSKNRDPVENRASCSYLEACFFDGIPADYEIAAALDTSEEAEREDIFEAVFQFYTFMQNTVSSIVSNSTVISDIARSLGISNESYCRITGATSKEKQNPKDRVLRSEIRNANYKKWT